IRTESGASGGLCHPLEQHLITNPLSAGERRLTGPRGVSTFLRLPASGRGGGTGRRAGFRCQWGKPRGGSSPLLGTTVVYAFPRYHGFSTPRGLERPDPAIAASERRIPMTCSSRFGGPLRLDAF